MDTLYPHCAGLDVPKETVFACVRHQPAGGRARSEVRSFSTLTAGLLELADWLASEGVSPGAMESTGVYWKPVYHVLDGSFTVLLVNAQHIKQVPGRKTDIKDCAWVAQLLQHGLLKASFVPPEPIRELRDLTRQRSQLVGERTRAANRIQKVLEDANIKLARVASDVLGKSARAMLQAVIAGRTDPEELAELAQGRLREKLPQLQQALRGHVTEHHRFLLRLHVEQVRFLDGQIEELSARVTESLRPFEEKVQRLMEVPGIGRTVAEVVIAERGPDLDTFPSDGHLSSWAGVAPGNDVSAGKRRSGKTTRGSRWLKAALVQAAHAAGRKRKTYLSARFRRLMRRGKKRAVMAVAHSLVRIIYQVLKEGKRYQELGEDYFDRLRGEVLTRRLVQRLEQMGHKVTLEPVQKAS